MSQIKLGNTDIPFVFRGDELMYPNYVKDGLVLHYDFSGMTNADTSRGIATDLSGNGNHGTLQNFNYSAESGYDKNKLLFDGVDDSVSIPLVEESQSFSFLINLSILNRNQTHLISFSAGNFFFRVNANGSVRLQVQSSDGENNFYDVVGSEVIFQTLKDNKHLGVVFDKDLIILYAEAIEVGRLKPTSNLFSSNINGLGYWGSNYSNLNIYSLHVYNRPLTPEEIAHNYAIEKERFGIE